MLNSLLAIFVSLGAAAFLNYGAFYQKIAVDNLPRVELRLSWTVAKSFITNKPWLFSMGIMTLGGILFAIAIAIAPISIVVPLVGSGVALLAYLAITRLGEQPGKKDLYAIAMSIVGVIFIAISMTGGMPEKITHDPVELWVFTGVCVGIGLLVALFTSRGTGGRQAAGLGIMVGMLFGCVGIFARLLLVDWGNRWSREGIAVIFRSVFLLPCAILLIISVITYQAALQRGMAVIVVPLVAALANVIPIIGGMWALNEHLPGSTPLATLRLLGFALILVSAVMLSRFEATAEEAVT